MLASVPYALHVDRHGKIPYLLGRADRVVVSRVHDARVVEDYVEPAPRVQGFYRCLYVVFLGHVADLGGGVDALC